MNEKEIARLVNDNSKMSYTLGFVYGGLSEIVSTGNLTETQHSQLMALLQLLHKNCNAIFYSPESVCEHECMCVGNDSGHGHRWYKICRKCGMDLTKQNEST